MLKNETAQRIIGLIRKLGFNLYSERVNQRSNRRMDHSSGLEEFREHLGGQLTITLIQGMDKVWKSTAWIVISSSKSYRKCGTNCGLLLRPSTWLATPFNIVVLTPGLIGEHTPQIAALVSKPLFLLYALFFLLLPVQQSIPHWRNAQRAWHCCEWLV